MSSRSLLLTFCLTLAACGGHDGPPPRAYGAVAPDLQAQVLAPLSARPGVRLAMLPLDAEGEVARAVGALVQDELAAGLAQGKAVQLVERDKLEAVLREMSLQQSGLVREGDEISMGKLLGAQVLLALRATRVGDAVNVSFRLVDVEAGSALGGGSFALLYDEALQTIVQDRAARQNVRTSKEVLAAMGQVRAGELADAEKFFEPLSREGDERGSVGLMGLAAIAQARGDGQTALQLCERSQALSRAPSYCWVVRGSIAYGRGELEAAKDVFTRAVTDQGTLLDWQRAQAANGLGLVAMAEKQPDVALSFYDKAVQLDPTNAEAIGNQAHLLEQRGDLATAVALYQRGLKASPDDKVLGLLLRDAELRLAFAQDQARQTKIQTLASELVREGQKKQKPAGDEWTSARVTVSLLPWTEKGVPATRLGETEFMQASLRTQLAELRAIELVDRELLTQVLSELQLTSSALGDSATALKVGEIVAAKALLDGSVVRMDGETQVTLKLIDTATTRIVGTVSSIFAEGKKAREVSLELGQKLTDKLREVYPLRAKVLQRKGSRAELNVGALLGAKVGERFAFYAPNTKDLLGEGQVVEVTDAGAWVELAGSSKVAQGARAERR